MQHTMKQYASHYARSLIEASLDPLLTISSEGKIMDINRATETIIGLSREKIIGSDFFDYFTEPQKAREVYQAVFEKGSVTDCPLTLQHLSGKLTDVLFNGSVFRDENGKILGVVIVARDVTEQKIKAKELTEAKEFAEKANELAQIAKQNALLATQKAEDAVKAKQQFLSNMSHEIRTPMHAIIGFTKVLLNTELNSTQKEYLTAIKMSGDALIVLINDILDLSKVDAGKMTFEQIPFNPEFSLSSMLHLFKQKIQEKNLKLEVEYDKNIPEVLLGDPVRLHQIILNLISNAIKFTNDGSIKVFVEKVKETKNKVTLRFSVSDSGIGIEKAKLGKIFENFQQGSSDSSRLYGGTGLGLAIAKKLVVSQGGYIHVESEINKGSTFSFTLDFLKTDKKPDAEIEIIEQNGDLKRIKILVAEDVPLNQLLMKTILEEFGFECDIAENGKIAVEKMKVNVYDAILMDLQMPKMNGFEATEYIRKRLQMKIPIIALTADVTTVDLDKCTAVGMNEYIAKPIDERQLYNKIVKLVKQSVTPGEQTIEENHKEIKRKCTDLVYLMQRTKSNPTLMMEMIALYLEQTPPLIETMKQSLRNKDWDALYSAVHKMIPSFAIMGISHDFELMAKKVQEFATTQQQSGEIAELVLQLENVCKQACKELEIEYNAFKNIKNN